MKIKTTFKELYPGNKFTVDKHPEALFIDFFKIYQHFVLVKFLKPLILPHFLKL